MNTGEFSPDFQPNDDHMAMLAIEYGRPFDLVTPIVATDMKGSQMEISFMAKDDYGVVVVVTDYVPAPQPGSGEL